MTWYVTKLVFQIINESETLQFDEQLRLIRASDYSDAVMKAQQMGLDEETEFLSSHNHPVTWKFRAVTNLYPLENLEHGTELCSQTIEKRVADRYLETIALKNKEITANLVAISN